jgi:Nuclease-related domain
VTARLHTGFLMSAKHLRLRYSAICTGCGSALSAGVKASWDEQTRVVRCLDCEAVAIGSADDVAASLPDSSLSLQVGVPGGSAQRTYVSLHQRREQRIEKKWGRFAGVVKFLSEDPQSITAWAKGSEGERRLASRLQQGIGDRAVVLHDRKVPGTRGNIDHLVVASSGAWVVDTKNYRGLVERRDVGGWFRTDRRLFVAGRDRTKRVDGLGWQIDAVRTVMGDEELSITGVLCFADAEWRLFAKPFQLKGIWVTSPNKLIEMIGTPGTLTRADVARIALQLSAALPPAVHTP